MAEKLSRDLKEFLEILHKWRAQYLVIGAHAVGIYTEPRGTKDLDIWVNPKPKNAKLVFAALREHGAPLFGLTEAERSLARHLIGVVYEDWTGLLMCRRRVRIIQPAQTV